jgi:acyl-CoA dehydrogenase
MTERDALREVAREFTRREVTPYLQEWEGAGEVPRDLHLKAGRQGLLGISFRTEVGGEGGDFLDSIAAMEAMFAEGASSGLLAALLRPASRCRISRRRVTPTWSTGSSGRRSPAS